MAWPLTPTPNNSSTIAQTDFNQSLNSKGQSKHRSDPQGTKQHFVLSQKASAGLAPDYGILFPSDIAVVVDVRWVENVAH